MSIKKHTELRKPHKQRIRAGKQVQVRMIAPLVTLLVSASVHATDQQTLDQRVLLLEKQVAALQVLVSNQTLGQKEPSPDAEQTPQVEFDLKAFERLPEATPQKSGLLVDVMVQDNQALPLLPSGITVSSVEYQGNGVFGYRSILDQVQGGFTSPVGLYYRGYLHFPRSGEYVLSHSYISNGGNVVQRLATKGYCKSTLFLNEKQVSHAEGQLDNANVDSQQVTISREQGYHPFGLWLICHGTGEKVALNAVYNYVGTKLAIKGPGESEMNLISAERFAHR